jgi:hypothetical protein
MRGPDEVLVRVSCTWLDGAVVRERYTFVSVDDLKWDFPEMDRRDEESAILFLKDQQARDTEDWRKFVTVMDEDPVVPDDLDEKVVWTEPRWDFDLWERHGDQLDPVGTWKYP